MDTVREKLISCFIAVFTGLSRENAPAATMDTLQSWDSAHHFMLMHVVEETFDTQIPSEVFGELVSFTEFEQFLTMGSLS